MEHMLDTIAALSGQMTGAAPIAAAISAMLLCGYAILSLGQPRKCAWRRDKGNRSRLPVWRCRRCGTTCTSERRRGPSTCHA